MSGPKQLSLLTASNRTVGRLACDARRAHGPNPRCRTGLCPCTVRATRDAGRHRGPLRAAPSFVRGGRAMGRGRAKAKQTKVARELKYHSPNTDLAALQRELTGGGGRQSSDDF